MTSLMSKFSLRFVNIIMNKQHLLRHRETRGRDRDASLCDGFTNASAAYTDGRMLGSKLYTYEDPLPCTVYYSVRPHLNIEQFPACLHPCRMGKLHSMDNLYRMGNLHIMGNPYRMDNLHRMGTLTA